MLVRFRSLKKRYLQCHTGNSKELPTVCNCSNQEDSLHDKTRAHMVNVQTVTGGISRRVTKESLQNTSLILVDNEVKVIDGCYRNVMLL